MRIGRDARSLFVELAQSAIADDIGDQCRGEPTFHASRPDWWMAQPRGQLAGL